MAVFVSFLLCLVAFYESFYPYFRTDLKHLYMLSTYVVYVLLFVAYIVFKEKYSSLTRSFTSPLGIYGAALGIVIFLINTIGVLAFECRDEQLPLIILVIGTVIMSIHYFIILHGKQQFSEEEQKNLFKAYLINANVNARKKAKKQRKVAAGSMEQRRSIEGSCSRGGSSHYSDSSAGGNPESADEGNSRVTESQQSKEEAKDDKTTENGFRLTKLFSGLVGRNAVGDANTMLSNCVGNNVAPAVADEGGCSSSSNKSMSSKASANTQSTAPTIFTMRTNQVAPDAIMRSAICELDSGADGDIESQQQESTAAMHGNDEMFAEDFHPTTNNAFGKLSQIQPAETTATTASSALMSVNQMSSKPFNHISNPNNEDEV